MVTDIWGAVAAAIITDGVEVAVITTAGTVGVTVGGVESHIREAANWGGLSFTEPREITPYLWVHPDEERWARAKAEAQAFVDQAAAGLTKLSKDAGPDA